MFYKLNYLIVISKCMNVGGACTNSRSVLLWEKKGVIYKLFFLLKLWKLVASIVIKVLRQI